MVEKFPVCANLDEIGEFILGIKAVTQDALKYLKELKGDIEAFGHLASIYVAIWTISERYIPELEENYKALKELCKKIEHQG